MHTDIITEYLNYSEKIGNRQKLYKTVVEEFGIKSAIYPGSFIDIAPSMFVPKVTYIDNFKGAVKFFKHMDIIRNFIEENKEYKEKCEIDFFNQDYNLPLSIENADLIISQFGGFISKATKYLLKNNGILLCNDSHGDATLARFDTDFKLIGVIDNNFKIQSDSLESYFILHGEKKVDLKMLIKSMKGPRYKLSANNYLFRKV